MSDEQKTRTAGAPFSQTLEGKLANLEAANDALKKKIVERDTEIATLRAELARAKACWIERTVGEGVFDGQKVKIEMSVGAKVEFDIIEAERDQLRQVGIELAAALQLCKNTLEGHLDEPQAVSHAECRNAATVAGNALVKWEPYS